MKKGITTLLLLCAILSAHSPLNSAEITPETDEAFDARMEWFTEAQFGLFIHYGVYSTLGGDWNGQEIPNYAEWIQCHGKITPEEYIPLAADFNPEKLDADLWVKTAKEAGMKYLVITTKHHEGFCLWDSAHTEYDLGEVTKFNRDILGELKAACEEHGLRFGTYYSIIDWHHPSQRDQKASYQTPLRDKEGYVTYMKAQLKELIDNYDPAIMWFDGDWVNWWTMQDGIDLYNYLRELSPKMIINNRVAKRGTFKKDYGTPENSTPGAALDHIWEACWTVNHSWGYKRSDTKWKSIDQLVQKQIDINTKDGNLLLNVGPHADGSWPEGSTKLLLEMGEWNKRHKDAVWGTKFVDLPQQDWGRLSQSQASTPEKGELFAYVFNWPRDGALLIKGLHADSVETFTYEGAPLASSTTAGELKVDLSKATQTPHATVLRIKYKGLQKGKSSTFVNLGLKGDELLLPATEATLNGTTLKIENNSHIGCWTNPTDTATWTLNVPAPGTYAVKYLYSCGKGYAGSDVLLKVGSQSLSAQVKATKTWEDFQLLEVGKMKLDEVGTVKATVGFGTKQHNALFNLKAVILDPVSE